MSDERTEIANLFGVIAQAAGRIAVLMGGKVPSDTGGGDASPDSELDSKFGNEQIKRDPKRWTGRPHAPCLMSECEPEFLECYAEFKDWTASKNDEKAAGNGPDGASAAKYAGYDRKSARRARGWRRRILAGWKPAERNDSPPDLGTQPSGDAFEDSPFDAKADPNDDFNF
jgi:hypothetical protein